MSIIIFLAVLILVWQGFYTVSVDLLHLCKSYSVPSPLGVGERFVEFCTDGSLFSAVGNSLLRGLIGFFIAVLIGVIVGLLINHFKYLNKNIFIN